MANLSLKVPPSNDNIVVNVSQPHSISPKQNVSTSFIAICDSQTNHSCKSIKPQVMNQLNSGSEATGMPKLSGDTSPILLLAAGSVGEHSIDQQSELKKTSEQVTTRADETLQQNVTKISQENDININHLIQHPEPPDQLEHSSNKVETQIRRAGKRKLPKFFVDISEDTEEKPSKEAQYDSIIPKNSTTFIHNGIKYSFEDGTVSNNKIGEGVHGIVFPATLNGPPDLQIAVKKILRSNVNEVKTMEFLHSTSCRHIVKYYCAVINPSTDSLYICMERMDASLAVFGEAMHLQGEISYDAFNRLIRQIIYYIASALSDLNKQKIVHGDIKPHNMLISKNGAIKLCDFGSCATYGELKSKPICGCGALYYTSPKLVEDPVQNDIWSFGYSLYQIITGKQLFEKLAPAIRDEYLLNWEPIFPTTIPDGIQKLILHLLKIDLEERFNSFEEVLNDSLLNDIPEILNDDDLTFICNVIEYIPQVKCFKW